MAKSQIYPDSKGLIIKMVAGVVFLVILLSIIYTKMYAIPDPPATSPEAPDQSSKVMIQERASESDDVEQLPGVDQLPSLDAKELAKAVRYPEWAKETGLEGQVILNVLISSEGKLKRIEVINSTDKVFEKPAISAVKKIKFEPGKAKGNPVDAWLAIPIDFKLEK
ncbi:MAG: energy transducer TonB [FCB group bacterium]|jgi:protein TonB